MGSEGDNTVDCSLIAAGFSWFELSSWIGIFWMGVGLGFIIFVHELGHFLAAKSCGVKVEAFYVGFNIPFPKLFGVTIIPQHLCKFTIGETVYGIGNLPLGGYVKMLGQEDAPPRADEETDSDGDDSAASSEEPENASNEQEIDPRDYRAKSVLQRFWIISAGVIMNLLTARRFLQCSRFGMVCRKYLHGSVLFCLADLPIKLTSGPVTKLFN